MNVRDLVGLSEQLACDTLDEAEEKIIYRIERWKDGYQVSGETNMSYDEKRVNLKIEGNIVIDAWLG